MVERARNERINVYLSHTEKEMLFQRATLAECTISEYIRLIVAYGNFPVRSERLPQNEVKELLYEINRIGNNINQIAYRCNGNGTANLIDVADLARQFTKLFEKITDKYVEGYEV